MRTCLIDLLPLVLPPRLVLFLKFLKVFLGPVIKLRSGKLPLLNKYNHQKSLMSTYTSSPREIAFKIITAEGGSAGAQIVTIDPRYKRATPMESTMPLAIAP